VALEVIRRIGELYDIEREIRGKLPEERLRVRQERARSRLEDLLRYLRDQLRSLSKKSALAGAIGYALGQWEALVRYASDGRVEIDNNAANAAGGICRVMPTPGLCRVHNSLSLFDCLGVMGRAA
jgi:transposase